MLPKCLVRLCAEVARSRLNIGNKFAESRPSPKQIFESLKCEGEF